MRRYRLPFILVLLASARTGFAGDRTALTQFADAFQAGDVAAMQGLMDDKLRADLGAEALSKLRTELLGEAQEFRNVVATHGRYFVGSVRLVGFQVRTRGEKYVVRLTQDKSGKFKGLDVVLDDHEHEPPRQDWCFGALPARYAAATGAVEIEPLGVDGQVLPNATVELWHAIDADPQHSWAWRDPGSGQWWEPIFHSPQSQRKFDRLEAGEYTPVVWDDRGQGYVGVGGPITIDRRNSIARVRVAVAAGGRLEVQCVDAETGGQVPELHVTAAPVGRPIWEKPQFPFRGQSVDGQRNSFVFARLPAAKLQVQAIRRASNPDDVIYEAAPTKVEIKPGETAKLVLQVAQRKMTNQEIDQRWPWEVYGRVTNKSGAPVKGAVVRAYSGLATLFCTGAAVSNAAGDYRLRFTKGFWSEEPLVHHVLISADMPGMYETSLNQQGRVAAADPNATDGREDYRSNEIIERHQPRRLDFVLAPAGELTVRVRTDENRQQLLDGLQISLKGEVMPPGCSVVDDGHADRSGWKRFAEVPLDHEWCVEITWGDRETVRTQPFRLTDPQRYSIELQWRRDTTGVEVLEIASLEDALGRDQTSKLASNNPLTHPPATAAEQLDAQEWLRRIADANRDWLDAPAEAVADYAYDFVMQNEPAQRYVVPRDRSVAGVVLQGIAFVSAAECLTKHPENVVFRQIDRSEERVTFSYSLLEPSNMSAGNGVISSYHRFFSMNFREGTLSFDPRTYRVLECRTKDVTERFGDYFELAEGRHVPRTIEIFDGAELRHRWKFAVYEPGLWLFDESVAPRQEESAYQVRIENVSINGAAARRMATDIGASAD